MILPDEILLSFSVNCNKYLREKSLTTTRERGSSWRMPSSPRSLRPSSSGPSPLWLSWPGQTVRTWQLLRGPPSWSPADRICLPRGRIWSSLSWSPPTGSPSLTRPLEAAPMTIFSVMKRKRGLKRPVRNRVSQAAPTGQQLSSSPSSRLPAALFDRFKKWINFFLRIRLYFLSILSQLADLISIIADEYTWLLESICDVNMAAFVVGEFSIYLVRSLKFMRNLTADSLVGLRMDG